MRCEWVSLGHFHIHTSPDVRRAAVLFSFANKFFLPGNHVVSTIPMVMWPSIYIYLCGEHVQCVPAGDPLASYRIR